MYRNPTSIEVKVMLNALNMINKMKHKDIMAQINCKSSINMIQNHKRNNIKKKNIDKSHLRSLIRNINKIPTKFQNVEIQSVNIEYSITRPLMFSKDHNYKKLM